MPSVSGGKAGNIAVTCSASISLRAGAGSKWVIETKVPNACSAATIGWVDAVWNMGQGANTRSPSA
jgi:hypothetical protein